ncbi:Eco57I restriction-modification methylase domain-containing protein [Psychroflexus sp. ALD_RP9]|uniref:Eco57I restriction-modification methylase domain-containing protein n=1 Tax=Psychroflexus sp. ALD_RP9 TaxID=2777186 RepID=UPI001F5D7471|nr:DNA methyltransferase [Psychroflexus sp. ALD_RP9]
MALFQSTVVQKYLKAQNQKELQEKWEAFQAHFHDPSIQENIRNAKEEQYQEGFLRDLFVKILGYTLNPDTDFNLTTELKNVKNSKKADGGILVKEKVVGVIELKGTNTTDLSKVETQAFGYKNNQTNCTYVITSNFEKLRFYIDNAIEHQAFNLFELNQEQFNLLYLCLAYQNISKDTPKKIKTESLSQEDTITKQLYKDYSLFKRELFNNLTQLNPDVEALLLFKKSQKLLDRFLFLFFAEDRHLLPPNSVRLILKQWEQLQELDAYTPLYQRFKKYFSYLNTGHKGKQYDVYPYNGGLFKPDEVLDEVKIDDDLLYKHTLKLSEYDFDSEVDVNILGHIFENSLNEIEEIQEKLSTMGNATSGHDSKGVTRGDDSKDITRGHDSKDITRGDDGKHVTRGHDPLRKENKKAYEPLVISKRKKDGVFYTPKYITKYIVENTVGKLCEEQKETLNLVEEDYQLNRQKKTKEKLLQKLKDYRDWLLQLTIVDPACGSGAFLNEALNFLIAEHQYVDELETKLMGGGFVFPNIENSILENNLFGVDINNESVEIAKLSLWLRTAQPNRKLNDLSKNIKCGNSLIDDPEVAGEKAFKWETEFPQVFQEKNNKIYHITTAIHDSRTSPRMKRYKVRERRDGGTNPYPNVVYFTPEDDYIVTKSIYEIVEEDQLKLLAYNICGDHVHLLIACEIEEVPSIMQKLKSITSLKVNKARKSKKNHAENTRDLSENTRDLSENTRDLSENTRGLSENTRGHDPLRTEKNDALRKEQNKPLWQQKYSQPKEVTSHEQLNNTINYIQRNRSKHELPKHPKATQALINQMCCTIDEAFKTEYKGGFDVVIGNPPYVNARTMIKAEREWLNKNHKQLTGAWDLYVPFLLKFASVTKNKIYGWIIPNKLLISDYAEKSLEYLKRNGLNKAINISTLPIFKNVGVYPIIIIADNSNDSFNVYEIRKIENLERINDFIKEDNKFKRFKTFGDYDIQINSGTTGFEAKKILPLVNEDNEGINFAVSGSIDPYLIDISTVPYMKNRFSYPKIKLDKDILADSKIEFWNTPKVIIAGMTKRLEAFYTDKPLGLGVGIYGIYGFANFNPKFLLAILNSRFITFYLINEFKDKHLAGGYLAINKSTIEQLPLVRASHNEQLIFETKADQMLALNKELQEVSSKFKRNLQRQFPQELGKLPKKLQDWYELSFADFIKELKKKKIKLSLGQEAEWEDYFLAEQAKAKNLKNQIDQTDKEIDQMVYELYGLTDEEIKIVEGAT